VDIALPDALAPVLRDLASSGAPVPQVRDEQWPDFPGQVTAMLHDTDGTAQGVHAMATEPLPQRVAAVAGQIQEWVIEALWRDGQPATWPQCPEHPNSHPLTAAVQEDSGAWICPGTGHRVDDIGGCMLRTDSLDSADARPAAEQ
jgi:hypothetical protein